MDICERLQQLDSVPAPWPVSREGMPLAREAAIEIARLRGALTLMRLQHYQCGDCWYSCPKSEEGCCNDELPKDKCTCGADEHNARIEAFLAPQQCGEKA